MGFNVEMSFFRNFNHKNKEVKRRDVNLSTFDAWTWFQQSELERLASCADDHWALEGSPRRKVLFIFLFILFFLVSKLTNELEAVLVRVVIGFKEFNASNFRESSAL